MGLFDKRIRVDVDGHVIEGLNTWFDGAAIFVDGVEIARQQGLLALDAGQPFVNATIEGRNGPLHIELHILAILFTQMELRVNGAHVAGAELVKEGAA